MKSDKPDFAPVFEKLKRILRKYQKGKVNGTDEPGKYTLVGPPTEKTRGKPMWFGAVITQKHYVSYHLMPVYGCRELLQDISPGLKLVSNVGAAWASARGRPRLALALLVPFVGLAAFVARLVLAQ